MKAMRFFFYGTLVAGHTNPVARMIHARLRSVGAATLAGSLHAIPTPKGWYPALLPGGGMVHGMLYVARAGFSESDLARMDDYEDYHPGSPRNSLYIRESVTAFGEDGKGLKAQTYRFNQPIPQNAKAIPGGDFAAWLGEHGLTAFASARH